jgi:hypothetical protein
MLRLAQSVATRPFLLYSNALDTHPIKTKCLTSGIMYSGGDIIAQWGENYNNNLARRTDGKADKDLEVNWKRAGIFFVFGTFLGGPAYHYWFNYLDELPAVAYRLKALRERGTGICVYVYIYMYVYMNTFIYFNTYSIICVYSCVNICVSTSFFVYVSLNVMYLYLYILKDIYIYVCV